MPLKNATSKKRKKDTEAPHSVKSMGSKKVPAPGISIDTKVAKNYASILALIKRQFKNRKETAIPKDLKPMLATLTDKTFDDQDWQFEIKWDGYRTLAYVQDGNVQLRSRNNLSFNLKYPSLVTALKEWPVNAVLDGEIVILNQDGKADFGALQNWPVKQQGQLIYYVFDLLWLAGVDLRDEPLSVRRKILKKVFPQGALIRFSESIDACGTAFFATAAENGLEGIIAKQKNSFYTIGARSNQWLKIKAESRLEAIICGYTKKKDSPRLISSLILGIPQNGVLEYIGQVGTGFNRQVQQQLFEKMNPLFTAQCPFAQTPYTGAPTMWVTPVLLCEVKYTERTKDGLLRHPSFQGLREDKTATEINIETNDFKDHRQKSSHQIQKNSHAELISQDKETATVTIDNHRLILSNLTKPYWPNEKITKRNLLNYYHAMAPYIMPYLLERPQSLNRFPNGITGKSFYQKDMKGKTEPWLTTYKRISEASGEAKHFLVCTDTASLLYMANMGCIELNPWHSRITAPGFPDWCVIDLDPGIISFEKVIKTANVVHDLLESLGIPSFPKTSGSTGIHIYIPLGAKYNYEQSRQLAELIATLVHHELSSFTSLVRDPAKRKEKIYIDFLQNRPIQTICAPYSVRPKPGAMVSAPLHWSEVKKGLRLSQFTIHNMFERVKSEGDLFKEVLHKGIDLNKVLKSLTSFI